MKGFGLNMDGSGSFRPGKAWREVSSAPNAAQKESAVQLGLTPGCHITAIGWNKLGTERSSSKILLGSSFGEIYEYEIEVEDDDVSSSSNSEEILPSLMVRLNESESGAGTGTSSGIVSGLVFSMGEGENAGVVVLAATSGVNKQTRLHSYLSTGNCDDSSRSSSKLRTVFASSESLSRRSFMELPGSINYADLQVCNGSFAMRTETGIYFGMIDQSSSRNVPWNKRGNGILDAGMFSYETTSIPISIAMTPHHFITLCESNEVRFVNRVAKKTIQKERVDWVAMVHSAGSNAAMDDGIFSGRASAELIMDVRRPDQVWLRKSRSLMHVSSTREDRDVWKFSLAACLKGSASHGAYSTPHASMRRLNDDKYMDAEFEHTKSLCTDDAQKAVVTAARAEFHLSHGRIELAAKYMAQCPPSLVPFAETAVRLALPSLGIKDNRPISESNVAKEALKSGNVGLIAYLSDKMRSAKARNDSVACTMLGAWLVELYLNEREQGTGLAMEGERGDIHVQNMNASHAMMQQFLSSNAYNMDAKTILRIMCSHNVAASECSVYAASAGDIGTAVNAALCNKDYMAGALDALSVLADASIEQAEPFYYKHAFTLLSRAPMASAKGFLGRSRDGLRATKLLPIFMRYEKKRSDIAKQARKESGMSSTDVGEIQIAESRIVNDVVEMRIGEKPKSQAFVDDEKASITYLVGAISLGCKSTAVYNYLVSLYVDLEDETPLYQFLSKHISSAATVPGLKPRQKSPLDLPCALRIALQSGRHFRSVIKLYMGLGMRQRAVELAINVDPVLAKELTRDSIEREEKKRLWLMIAKNAAEEDLGDGENVVSKVLSVLNECGPDLLSIEDVLPFLPDVAQIDQFRDEICDALTSYSSRIEGYLKEMNDCDHTCNGLREEIRRLGDYTTNMNYDAKCVFTEKSVVNENEPFYVFPSGFVALESALKIEVIPYLNAKQTELLASIEKEIQDIKGQIGDALCDGEVKSEGNEYQYRMEELQCKLDGLIAAECPLTGSIMIESIDHGFCDSKEDEVYIASDNLIVEA